MTDSGESSPRGTGGHAWERLREQRERELGEDPGPLPRAEESDVDDVAGEHQVGCEGGPSASETDTEDEG